MEITLDQVAGDFSTGVRWRDEPEAALPLFARLGSRVLTPAPHPSFIARCAALGLFVESERDIIATLSLPEAARDRWPLARVRRALLEVSERTEEFAVLDLGVPRRDPARDVGSGDEERWEAEQLVEWVTVCFSVLGVRAVYLDRLVDAPNLPAGLLAAGLRPKRSYKLLRGLLQREWRTYQRVVTDPRGEVSWQGSKATYELTAALPDGTPLRATRAFSPGEQDPVWEISPG